MSLSNYAELKVLDHIFRDGEASWTPGAQYVSLHTGNPGEANDGANEVTAANGYLRVQINDGSTTNKWAAAAAGEISTDTDIQFAAASGGDWGIVTHIGIYDASSSGNLIAYGQLGTQKTITNGDTFVITSGNLTVTLD